MSPSNDCLAIIREFEGLRLQSYKCPAGFWTIGYGSTGPDIGPGLTWTQAQAEQRLHDDVSRFAEGVSKLVGKATQGQFDALVSFAYNLGLGALRSSTLLKLHRAGDYAGAAEQFARWTKAAGRVLPGLVRRRVAEARLYRS